MISPFAEEKHVPAPEGRVTVRGRVVSKKGVESAYGWTLKMTVKVETTEGTWLAWGTVPADLALIQHPTIEYQQTVLERGDEIEFTATLACGRDAHFAIFKRPTKARVIAFAPREPEAPREQGPVQDHFAEFERRYA
jgi:hypothetical protein